MKKMKYHVVCFGDDDAILEFDSFSRNVRRHFLDVHKIYNFSANDVKVFSIRSNALLSQAQLIDNVLLVGTPYHAD